MSKAILEHINMTVSDPDKTAQMLVELGLYRGSHVAVGCDRPDLLDEFAAADPRGGSAVRDAEFAAADPRRADPRYAGDAPSGL